MNPDTEDSQETNLELKVNNIHEQRFKLPKQSDGTEVAR